MKRNYLRKAIFTVLMLATLCQSFPTYIFDEGFHELVSLELDIDYENESENEKEEQNKKELEKSKDKIYPKANRFSIAKLALRSNDYFDRNDLSNYKAEIHLPPPETVV